MPTDDSGRTPDPAVEAREWGLALERERDEMAANAAELSRQLAAVRAAERQLASAVDVISAERDQLKAHALRLRDEVDLAHATIRALSDALDGLRSRLFVEPGHYYSPIVDPGSPPVLGVCAALESRFERACDGVEIDEPAMLALLDRIAVHARDLPFSEAAAPRLRYHFSNDAFNRADALIYAGLLREFRPRRVVEVGAGFSTALLMDVNDLFLGGSTGITVVEPYPETLLSLVAPGDPYRGAILAKPLQEVDLDLFLALEDGDILFIDSSHVAKTASDVLDYMFRILPVLKPGVLVHIHDIFYPFEYPPEWIRDQNRSWNEAYLLHAFLHRNTRYEVLFFNDLICHKHAGRAAELLALRPGEVGASLWLRRTKAA